MEFNLTTDIANVIPKAIVFNYEEIKKELVESIQPYKQLVVSADDIKNAKADRARLNALEKALDEKRKEIKNTYLSPYTEFEKQVKDLISIVDEGKANIDKQVKAIDEKEQQEKWKEISKYYEEKIGQYEDMLPIETIVNQKWRNKTVSLDAIKEEMDAKIYHFDTDIRSILDSNIANKDVVIEYYVEHPFDLGSAMLKADTKQSQQNALKKAFGSAYNKTLEELEKSEIKATDEPTKDICIKFYATTKAFRQQLKEICIKNDIYYEGGGN